MRPDPLNNLLRCTDFVARHDPDLAIWLREAVLAHIREGTPLDRALELSGSLGRSARFAWMRTRRDAHLQRALVLLEGNHAALAEEVRRYLRRLPSCVRAQQEPPSDWPEWRREIHRAAAIGLPMPESRDGLRKALGSRPAVSRAVERTPSVPS